MSQNQPKPPVPANKTPKTPNLTSNKSETSLTKVTQTLEQSWKRAQPVLKTQSIGALRTTIKFLEAVVEKLEAQPTEKPSSMVAEVPPPVTISPVAPVDTQVATPTLQDVSAVTPVEAPLVAPVDTAVTPVEAPLVAPVDTTVTPVEAPLVAPEVTQAESPVADSKKSVSETPTFVDRFLPSFDRLQSWRTAVLQTIRAILTKSLNQKLSDWALTGAIAGVLVVVLWTSAALIPRNHTEVVTIPPSAIKTPPELTAPKSPEPVPVAPPPKPVLTPEQDLIASIQNQVAEITSQYADGLIQSLEANFQGSRLIVKVSDGWYNLSQSKQDKLADEMLSRSQELDFSKLEIVDPQGTLVARSPVVGIHMVILQRQTGS